METFEQVLEVLRKKISLRTLKTLKSLKTLVLKSLRPLPHPFFLNPERKKCP